MRQTQVVEAYIQTQATSNSTTIVRTVTTTTTQTASSNVSSVGFSSSSTVASFSVAPASTSAIPIPIGQDIKCPKSNDTTQPIVIGNDVYIYVIHCNATFVNETNVLSVAAQSFRGCLDACSSLNSLSGATDQVCHGVDYDGVTCSLRNPAAEPDLVYSPGLVAAILWQVIASGTSLNRTFTTSSVSTITPPPVISGSTTEQAGCSATTTTLAGGVISWTSTCSSYSSWWSSYISEATTIYSTEVIGGGICSIQREL